MLVKMTKTCYTSSITSDDRMLKTLGLQLKADTIASFFFDEA